MAEETPEKTAEDDAKRLGDLLRPKAREKKPAEEQGT